jgi:hypothetical protein
MRRGQTGVNVGFTARLAATGQTQDRANDPGCYVTPATEQNAPRATASPANGYRHFTVSPPSKRYGTTGLVRYVRRDSKAASKTRNEIPFCTVTFRLLPSDTSERRQARLAFVLEKDAMGQAARQL